MTTFIDGPAAGVMLMLRRAPHFLRVVHNGSCEKWDALDQLDDQPSEDESVVVYEMVGQPTWCHIRATKGGGCYRGGQYKVVESQPPDQVVRDRGAWQRWAFEEVKARGLA